MTFPQQDTPESNPSQLESNSLIQLGTDPNHVLNKATEMNPEPSKSSKPKLSKRAMKRLLKQQEWEKSKAVFKEKRKEKRKQKKLKNQELKAQDDAFWYSIKQGIFKESQPRNNPNSVPSGVKIIIDCQFDDKMGPKEMKSLCKQLMFCYTANRRSAKSVDLVCTGFSEKLEEQFLQQAPEYKQWKIAFTDSHYLSMEPKNTLVYLTADSDTTLETLEPGTVYIIGGLVDHNHYKNECLNKANVEGIKHAKLPISDYIQLQSRKVLAVNHCVEIMLKYLETNNWKDAFLACIPQRKAPQPSLPLASNNAMESEHFSSSMELPEDAPLKKRENEIEEEKDKEKDNEGRLEKRPKLEV